MHRKDGRSLAILAVQIPQISYLLKFACAERLPFRVRVQVFAVPEHALLQPVNVFPSGGVAVSVTTVPALYFAEQVLPQLIPDTSLVTVPVLLWLT